MSLNIFSLNFDFKIKLFEVMIGASMCRISISVLKFENTSP